MLELFGAIKTVPVFGTHFEMPTAIECARALLAGHPLHYALVSVAPVTRPSRVTQMLWAKVLHFLSR